VCVCAFAFVCVFVRVLVYVARASASPCYIIAMHTHPHTHTPTYAHPRTHTHTHTQAFRPTFRADDRGGLDQGRAAGALLSVCWANGRIANYPLYFPSLEGQHNKPPYAARD